MPNPLFVSFHPKIVAELERIGEKTGLEPLQILQRGVIAISMAADAAEVGVVVEFVSSEGERAPWDILKLDQL